MTLRRPINQEEEIKTIKSRNYNLNLSDADVERLAEKALSYGLTAAELLENFIGDIVNGTYSNGSDERMYASEWAERCWFALDSPEKTFYSFFLAKISTYHVIPMMIYLILWNVLIVQKRMYA